MLRRLIHGGEKFAKRTQAPGQIWPSVWGRVNETFDRGHCDPTIAPLSSVQSHQGLKV